MTGFLLYPHMVGSGRERNRKWEGKKEQVLINPVMWAPPSSKPNYLKASSSKLGFRASTYQLEEIHSALNYVCVCVLALSFWHYTCCKLIVFISCTVWKQPFLQGALVTLLENDIRNQDLGSRCAYCCWSAIASRPPQQKKQENMRMYTNSHVDKYP